MIGMKMTDEQSIDFPRADTGARECRGGIAAHVDYRRRPAAVPEEIGCRSTSFSMHRTAGPQNLKGRRGAFGTPYVR
jgi:hypothetical protein